MKFGWVAQEIYNLGYFFLGLIATCHIGKGNTFFSLVQHARLALAKREKPPSFTAALHLAHEKNPHANEQQHWEPRNKNTHQKRLLFFRLGLNRNTVLDQVRYQPQVLRRIAGDALTIASNSLQHASFDSYLGDTPKPDFFQKARVIYLRLRGLLLARVELIEYGHQHQRHDHPNSDTLKQVVQSYSLTSAQSLPCVH